MNELTLVWNRKQDAWEVEWIEYLFQNIPHKTIANEDHSQFIDNSVIIDSLSWNRHTAHNQYCQEMQRRKYQYGFIHLSDEGRDNDISSYQGCKFILRNHFKPDMPDNCLMIPLGYNSGFIDHKHNPNIINRTYLWTTIVHRWDHNRNLMAEQIQRIPHGFFYVAEHHGPRLSVQDYSRIYRDSIFVICPNGNIIPDSFRICEAMEAGAIPIVQESDYWDYGYGKDFPALRINNWNELLNKIITVMMNPKEVEILRNQCTDWWTDRKTQAVKEVTELVTTSMQLTTK